MDQQQQPTYMMRQQEGLQPVFYSQSMAEAVQQDNRPLLHQQPQQSIPMYPSLQAAPSVIAPVVAPQITIPQAQSCPFQRGGCRFSQCCKNPEKVLRGLMISQIVFGALGIFLGSFISGIARIVIASFGLKFLKRRNTGKLQFYAGVSAMNAVFTLTLLIQAIFIFFAVGHRMHGMLFFGFIGFVCHIASLIAEVTAVYITFKAVRKIKADKKSSLPVESELESVAQEIQAEQREVQIPILAQPVQQQQPIVVSQPVVLPQQQQQVPQNVDHQLLIKYRTEIKLLGDMGFADVRLTVPLLEKHQGNIQSVVQELISKH